ncbi:MAG TPA: DNA repair exonuclease, partial [Halanaerobiales bacterium]|nr:DNA repair exonuclease [Halanaerobiales bacterium]
MTAQIRFIHTADLHLGAPLNCGGKPPTQLSALFNQSGYQAFERLVDSALKYGVDFVLIAGDLYDREARSVKAARFFTGQCQRLQEEEISVYIISGNHDPLGGAREPFSLPENVHIFGCEQVEEKEYTDSGGRVLARLLGQSYRQKFESRKMCTYYNPSAGDSFNIGLLHTQLEPQNNHYVPVAAAELLSKDNIDYWALGHIHQPRIVHSAHPYIIYPGTPQGRDINEEGVRGCFLIEVAGKKEPELNFIPLSPVIYKKITVDISTNRGQQVQNLSKLEEILQDKAEGLLKKRPFTEHSFPASEVAAVKENDAEEGDKGQTDISNIQENKASPGGIFRGYIVRWSITGRTPLHEIIEDNREEATAEILNKL